MGELILYKHQSCYHFGITYIIVYTQDRVLKKMCVTVKPPCARGEYPSVDVPQEELEKLSERFLTLKFVRQVTRDTARSTQI